MYTHIAWLYVAPPYSTSKNAAGNISLGIIFSKSEGTAIRYEIWSCFLKTTLQKPALWLPETQNIPRFYVRICTYMRIYCKP